MLDAAPKGGWRQVGGVGAGDWRELHDRRRQVVRLLRQAGYVARRRWNRTRTERGWTYRGGAASGREAVDPWDCAEKLRWCSASWYAQLRITGAGELRVIALPRGCGLRHVCPSCAAYRSRQLAAGLRSLIAGQGGGKGALVTLTQRAIPGEPLHSALERLRAAMKRLWTGRPKASWVERVPDWYYGIETTRGDGGWWHVHAHVVIREAAPSADVARYIGERWRDATEAVETGQGWNPYAGGVRGDCWLPCDVPGWDVSQGWGWYRPIDLDDPIAVYQACKYPSPCATLPPAALAEFVAVAFRRRWHDGGGAWRGATAAEDVLPGNDEDSSYDIGQNIARCGPRDVPALAQVAPGLGLSDELQARREERTTLEEWVRWRLTAAAELSAVVPAVQAAGGSCYAVAGGQVVELRRVFAEELVRAWDRLTRTAGPADSAEPRAERDSPACPAGVAENPSPFE